METRTSCEREHEFALVLTGISDFDDNILEALLEAGCDDATVSLQHGKVSMDFTRTALSLKDAVVSAIRDVRRAGIGADVLRVDDCNLVTQAEIGRRSGRSRQVIHQYYLGQRGPGGFPSPVCQISDNAPLWRWCEVAFWMRRHNMIKEQDLVDARDLELINLILDYQHQLHIAPEEIESLSTELGSITAKA